MSINEFDHLYEASISGNPQWLLSNLQVLSLAIDTAKNCMEVTDKYGALLEKNEHEAIGMTFTLNVEMAAYLSKLLSGKPTIEHPHKGLFTVINKVPKTINQIMAESEVTDRKAVLAELKKLIKDGLVVKPTQQTYARYDAQTEDSGSVVEADG